MEEIVKLVTTSLSAVILFSIIGIVLNWLFIRSAVSSGVRSAITSDDFRQLIHYETKEAILDAMIETGLADETILSENPEQEP